ncbi:hypothetical protein CL622_07675 [archaeon]|nr:hypothetical protein [archaeon]|tara:strand:- start:16 stop:1305 length:1290 start_codon:yes stop_codon:yes gene_type:complete
MKLSKLLELCDKESAGYNKLVKVSNNRLRKGNIQEVRNAYDARFNEILGTVTDEYLPTIAKPIPYSKNKTKVNKLLRKLFKETNPENKEHTKTIHTYEEWHKFITASNKEDVVDHRVTYLERFFDKYRDPFIKNVYATDLGYGSRNIISALQSITELYTAPKRIRNNEDTETMNFKGYDDYYSSKQQVHTSWRCDFVIATRILEKVLAKFNLRLLPEFKEIAELAIIFENGISAFSIGKENINVLTAPELVFAPQADRSQNDLHSTTEAAYKSKDTGDLYFLRGVAVPYKYWKMAVDRKLTFEEWIKIKNIEVRRVIIDEAGADCFAKHPNAEISEKTLHGNTLITIRNAIPASDDPGRRDRQTDIKIINYKDPSTNRVYNSFVPVRLDDEFNPTNDPQARELTDPDEAMAWKFGKTKTEYYGELVAEA